MIAALILLSYVCGSLPFGYWLAKWTKGKDFDIRDHGSCSIGFTNVFRVLGLKTAIPVLILDIAKGFVPVWLCNQEAGPLWAATCLLATGLGHAKSLYFFWKEGVFSGGKSAATMLGGISAIQPLIAGICAAIFLLIVFVTRIVSVGTMLASVGAFGLSFVLHLGTTWNVVFGLVVGLILYTHRRNIARLIQGTEPKLGRKEELDEVVVAFLIHALDFSDLYQSPLSKWIPELMRAKVLSERMARMLIARGPVMENDQVTGIVTKTGQRVRILILSIPMLPDQIMDPANSRIVEGLLRSATVQAQRRGAKVLGLGALLSSAAGGGSHLQSWAEKRGLSIIIDNGAAFTAAATVYALQKETRVKLSEATVANVGAGGLIGYSIVKYLEDKVGQMIAFARRRGKLEGVGEGVLTTDELAAIQAADVVIFNTSSPAPIITPDNADLLKTGAVVLDVAVPCDVENKVLEVRLDLKLIRCGLILLPGKPRATTDFHFGSVARDGSETALLPACMAQCALLGLTEKYEHASRGARIRTESLDFFLRAAEEFGFEIVTSGLSEPALFAGRNQ